MEIKTRYTLGQRVYSPLDTDRVGMVTGFMVRPGHIKYLVTWNDHEEIAAYEMELSAERVRDFAD